MEGVETKISTDTLKSISEEGYIRFSIKADDTEENVKVHNAFKQFAKVECDNNYTQALRKLMEYYEGDFKYEMLWNKISEIESRLDEKKEVKKEEKNEVF
jgi:DNA-binding MarR family transcriptional regulator